MGRECEMDSYILDKNIQILDSYVTNWSEHSNF